MNLEISSISVGFLLPDPFCPFLKISKKFPNRGSSNKSLLSKICDSAHVSTTGRVRSVANFTFMLSTSSENIFVESVKPN